MTSIQSTWIQKSGNMIEVFFSTQPGADAECLEALPPQTCSSPEEALTGYKLSIPPMAQKTGTFSISKGEVQVSYEVAVDWGNGCEGYADMFLDGEVEITVFSEDCISGEIRSVTPSLSGDPSNDPNGIFLARQCS